MEKISPYLLLVIGILACLFSNTTNKIFSSKNPSDAFKAVGVSIFSLVSCITLYIWGGGFGHISTYSLVLGIVFGFVTFLVSILILNAYALGPFSYTLMLVSLSMLLPTFSGAIFWNETVSITQYIGTALVIVCIILSVEKNGDDKKANLKWLICTGFAFLANGSVGIIQKMHQNSPYADELGEFLIVSFLTGAAFSALAALVFKIKDKREGKTNDVKYTAKDMTMFMLMFIIIGVCLATCHKVNLYLSGVLPAAVFFPATNGGTLVLTSITAFLFFKEKLTKKQWAGLITGTAAVFLLTM